MQYYFIVSLNFIHISPTVYIPSNWMSGGHDGRIKHTSISDMENIAISNIVETSSHKQDVT
jgi:hypothetical protein